MTIKQLMFRNLIEEELKITCTQLSKATGIPYSTVNDWINGKTDFLNSSFSIVLKVCTAYNLDPKQVYDYCTGYKNTIDHITKK